MLTVPAQVLMAEGLGLLDSLFRVGNLGRFGKER